MKFLENSFHHLHLQKHAHRFLSHHATLQSAFNRFSVDEAITFLIYAAVTLIIIRLLVTRFSFRGISIDALTWLCAYFGYYAIWVTGDIVTYPFYALLVILLVRFALRSSSAHKDDSHLGHMLKAAHGGSVKTHAVAWWYFFSFAVTFAPNISLFELTFFYATVHQAVVAIVYREADFCVVFAGLCLALAVFLRGYTLNCNLYIYSVPLVLHLCGVFIYVKGKVAALLRCLCCCCCRRRSADDNVENAHHYEMVHMVDNTTAV